MPPSDGTMDDSVFPPFIPGGFSPRREPAPAPAAAPAEPAPAMTDVFGSIDPGVDAALTQPPVEEEAQAAPFDTGAESEDLPWLELPPASRAADEEEEWAGAGGETAADAAPEEAFPDWLAWDSRDSDAADREVAEAAPEPWADDLVAGDGMLEMEYAATAVDEGEEAEDDAEPASEAGASDAWAADDEGEPPAGMALDGALADALAGVADQLERLAGTLRDRPGALLSGDSTDPLDLLVAGYALGLAQGRAHR